EDWLFFAMLAASGVLVLAHRFVPYADTTNILARWVLIESSWSDTPPADFEVSLALSNYLGLDIVGAGLVHLFGAEAAGKLGALLALLLPSLGVYLLLCQTAPERRGWAVAAVLLAFNWFFFIGMLHYLVGLGLCLLLLAGYWRGKRTASWAWLLAVGVAAPALCLVHLSAALMFLVVVGLGGLLTVVQWLRARRSGGAAPAFFCLAPPA